MEIQDLNNDNSVFLAQWLAGDLSDQELKTQVSEADFQSFLKIRKGIEAYEILESPATASFTKIKNRMSTTTSEAKVRKLNTSRWFIGVAASILVLFGLFSILDNDVVTIETNFAEQKTVALLDGSEVILNAKSTISYNEDKWENNRTLTLSGEAYFKVKKGSAFTVSTENGSVKVLGTQFNVNSVGDLFEVVCFEGKVSVQTKAENYVLFPTNSVRKINGHAAENWKTPATSPTWINGESSFKSVPLSYVISALESQYKIKIDSKNIDETLIYTGSFTHKDLRTALTTVFKSLQIQYIEKENGNIYLSTR